MARKKPTKRSSLKTVAFFFYGNTSDLGKQLGIALKKSGLEKFARKVIKENNQRQVRKARKVKRR